MDLSRHFDITWITLMCFDDVCVPILKIQRLNTLINTYVLL